MPRRRSAVFTDGELRIMRVLWDRERATVAEVVDGMSGERTPAYNTVLTMLRILETKGYVRHEKVGRAFTWIPLVDRGQARRSALASLLRRFFDDRPDLLVANLIEHGTMDADDLDRVRALFGEPAEGRPAGRRSGGTR